MSSSTVPLSAAVNKDAAYHNLIYLLRDHDVLLGRGNAINMRPGNLAFRRDVENLKVDYFFARRHEKIHVARRVVACVHERGGRFLKVDGYVDDQCVYVEIELDRALHKAGQALRERCFMNKKNDNNHEKMDDFVANCGGRGTPGVVLTLDTNQTGSMVPWLESTSKDAIAFDQSGGAGTYDDSLEEEQWAHFDDAEPPPSANNNVNTKPGAEGDPTDAGTSSCSEQSTGSFHPKANSMETSTNRAPVHRLMMHRSSATRKFVTSSTWLIDFFEQETSWEEMFFAVADFKEVNGHCAIAPSSRSPGKGSSPGERAEARLADWASVQRHVFREIQQGRRIATEQEKDRFARLQRIGFVFDYDEFHWTQRYEELIEFQQGDNPRGGTGADKPRSKRENAKNSPFAKCLRLAMWAKQQHELYVAGQSSIQRMRDERKRKFGRIDTSQAAKLQTKQIGTSAKSAAAFAAVLAGTSLKRTNKVKKSLVGSTTNSDAGIAVGALGESSATLESKSIGFTNTKPKRKRVNDSRSAVTDVSSADNAKSITTTTTRDDPDATPSIVKRPEIEHSCRTPDSVKQSAAAIENLAATVSPNIHTPDACNSEKRCGDAPIGSMPSVRLAFISPSTSL